MDTTFISIHDLTYEARLLYASNSIADILGYNPEDVVGKPCWEYFHPDEIPFAKAIHGRGVELDKAAVLNYCRIRNKAGQWIGCECVFTIVHDVLVGCTSVYSIDAKSDRRANDAPLIRQLFSSSPRDPRYHMLSYISTKFSQGPKPHLHEPRAALFVNRFTRTLTIMYATNGLARLLGITSQELVGKSFYFCIQENCLPEAIRCLENAKANDSIAYLRFFYRDPRRQYLRDGDGDATNSDSPSTDQDSDDGGVRLNVDNDIELSDAPLMSSSSSDHFAGNGGARLRPSNMMDISTSSGTDNSSNDRVFDNGNSNRQSSNSSLTRGDSKPATSRIDGDGADFQIELEAVISCTSDGLVVILREARPLVLDSLRPPTRVLRPTFADGYFASPWGQQPLVPTSRVESPPAPMRPQHFFNPPVATPPLVPQSPNVDGFWNTIRECAVFAWGLTGINGSLAQYSRGSPAAGSQPAKGLPVWQRDARDMESNMHVPMIDRMQD